MLSQAVGNKDLTRQFAEELVSFSFENLTSDDIQQLNRLILDHLGVCYQGASLPWGRALRQWASSYAGTGNAILFAEQIKSSAPIAALVNATAAHGLELDDTHDESISHPGAVVIATGLAMAQQKKLGGSRLLAAITVGYEVIGRIGAASGAAEVIERGFHPTALFGGFGATATAAHLLGLDAAQLCQAWGLTLSMAGGSMQFSEDAEGTTVKRLHAGYSAHHGVLGAEFAQLGIAGPAQAFDGIYGLCHLYGVNPSLERLLGTPEKAREIHQISFKPYPCCRLFHSTLDAMDEVTNGFTLPPEKIAKILVGGPNLMVSQHMLRRPTSEMAAQYSLPFTLSTAMYHGPHSVEGFSKTAMKNEQILALADRVEATLDAEMETEFPTHYGSWVELTTLDGQIQRSRVLDSLGTPARPMSMEALIIKFDELTQESKLSVDGVAVFDQLCQLPNMETIIELIEPFSKMNRINKGKF